MRTPQHDQWILDTFGVRMPGAPAPASSPAAPRRTSRLDRLRAAGRELASGGSRALAALSQGRAQATAELWQGAATGGRALAGGLRHAGGDLAQGVTGAAHDAADGMRHGHLATGLLRARERLDAKSGQAVGDAWHGLTEAVGEGAHGELGAVRAMGRANGQAFDRAVNGASAGTARVAGARAGEAVRRDAQRLSQPVRFLANFGLGAARGLGEAGGEIVKGTGDLAVEGLRAGTDAQYRAGAERDAKGLWHAAKPLAEGALHHPGHAIHAAGQAIKEAVNKTLDEGGQAQRDGGFAEWDGHFAFKLATNIATSVMPQTKAAKLAKAASLLRGGLKVEGVVAEVGQAARLAGGADTARAAGALRPGRAVAGADAHAAADGIGEIMADAPKAGVPGRKRAAVRFSDTHPPSRTGYQRLVDKRMAEAAERMDAGAPPRPAPGSDGVAPPLTEQVAFTFAILKDNQPGSWFEANCKGLTGERLLAKLEGVREEELEAKAPYCHAFLRASAMSRATGMPMMVDAHEAFRHLRKPADGFKGLNTAKAGRAWFLSDGLGQVEGQGRRVRYSAAQAITGIAGTATAMDRKRVMNVIAKYVPAQIIEALLVKGVDIDAVRDSVVERLPHLKGEQVSEDTAQTWDETYGVYSESGADKVIAIASQPVKDGPAGARRIPGRGDWNTVDVILHEIAHAVDSNMYGATRNRRLHTSRAFQDAVAKDAPQNHDPYAKFGHSEIFAEYMARFMRQPEDFRQKCLHLYAYFHSLINQELKP